MKKAGKLAAMADYVVLCLGLDEFSETEGLDRQTLSITQNQLDLLNSEIEEDTKTIIIESANFKSAAEVEKMNEDIKKMLE